MTDDDNYIYRVIFHQDGKLFEIYARYISEESIVGFLEVEELVLEETRSTILVDPNEEKMRQEFKDVLRTYIPIHLVVRIDEVESAGAATLKDANDKKNNVSHFPARNFRKPPSADDDDGE